MAQVSYIDLHPTYQGVRNQRLEFPLRSLLASVSLPAPSPFDPKEDARILLPQLFFSSTGNGYTCLRPMPNSTINI